MRKKGLFIKKALTFTLIGAIAFSPVYMKGFTNVTATSTISSVVSINEYGGWMESAYVEWAPVSSASGYNVYYKSASAADSAYTQIDTQLIRKYSSCMRADILGLKAGNYVVKIIPIMNGAESSSGITTKSISVTEHVREGFAFSKNSPMGTGSGGYQDDGTVPANAQILYVTSDTVNTVQLNVITNSKGTTTACTGLTDILAKRQKGYDKTPLIIRLVGTVAKSDISGLNSSGYLQMKGCYNVTLEGVGEDATAYGWGILVRDAHNLEIRNLGVMLFPDDGISLDTNNENIWVHNNDIFYGTAGGDADQAKGDGSCDVKGYSNYVTVSYNHFWDSGKCSLCGMSDSKEFFVSYHHNWFDHSDSRHPRIRVGTIHIYNNYFDGNAKYGVGVTKGSSAFVEANYFRNCKYPMLSSLQGSDRADGNEGTFSGEAGGMIKAYGNIVENAKRLVYAQDNSTEFDAYLASSRDEKVPASFKTVSGGTTYNNFDTDKSVMYAYTPDAASDVENEVTVLAGRVNGGDFDFVFNDSVDDTSYSMNTALMHAIKNYDSDLVSVGGNSIKGNNTDAPVISETPSVSPSVSPSTAPSPSASVSTEPSTSPSPSASASTKPSTSPSPSPSAPISSAYVQNFTADGSDSSYFSITGNLSDTKGTVTYNGLTMDTCLKMESKTSIKFTTTQAATLTLIANSGCRKAIKVDGTKYSFSNGTLEISLAAGSHTITKQDTSVNLYYMSVTQ